MESKNKNEQLLAEANRREEQHLRELRILRQTAVQQEEHLAKISRNVSCLFWFICGPTILVTVLIILSIALGGGLSLFRFGY